MTTGTIAATSTNIADYNAFAASQANSIPELAALNVNWVIVGGTAAVTALTNVGASTAPVYDLAGNLIGSSLPNICSTPAAQKVQHVVNVDQQGNIFSGTVWTGTADNCGTQSRPLGTNANAQTRRGSTTQVNTNWISDSNAASGGLARIYALSAEITAVPEPATFGMVGVVLAGAFFYRRRQTRG